MQISGEFSNVQNALYSITGKLRDNILPSSSNNLGSRMASSVLAETSPYGRLKDPIARGLDTSPGISPGLSRYATLTPSKDQPVLRHHLDHPSPPKLWKSQVCSLCSNFFGAYFMYVGMKGISEHIHFYGHFICRG